MRVVKIWRMCQFICSIPLSEFMPKPAPEGAPKPVPKPAPKRAPKCVPKPAPKGAPKCAPKCAPKPVPKPHAETNWRFMGEKWWFRPPDWTWLDSPKAPPAHFGTPSRAPFRHTVPGPVSAHRPGPHFGTPVSRARFGTPFRLPHKYCINCLTDMKVHLNS